ncbi:unnamed protein product [Ceratitis capitata]|uniref:(Mediterranean fruit fly) hypothetical protein n=1 Tax=Ceratitis capitata TaxID=7213 RepID=A0A811U8J3_CERCA|nr:unnamed protein product [Ceratitis capitata]
MKSVRSLIVLAHESNRVVIFRVAGVTASLSTPAIPPTQVPLKVEWQVVANDSNVTV